MYLRHCSTCRIIFALRQYANCAEQEISRWQHNYGALSARHRAILAHIPAKAAAARHAVQQNQLFIKAMLLNFAGQLDDGDAGVLGGGIVPNDLAAGALAYADHLQASEEQCSPGDAEKVLITYLHVLIYSTYVLLSHWGRRAERSLHRVRADCLTRGEFAATTHVIHIAMTPLTSTSCSQQRTNIA